MTARLKLQQLRVYSQFANSSNLNSKLGSAQSIYSKFENRLYSLCEDLFSSIQWSQYVAAEEKRELKEQNYIAKRQSLFKSSRH
jgi:hypothetical protein